MPWNSTCPVGSQSVKQNRTVIQDNITYIETTMGNSIVGTNTVTTRDHFWNVGANEDGRHRFIQSPAFTSTAVAPDDVYPVIGTGMDGVLFLLTTNSRAEWFHRNSQGIYQAVPSFLTGTSGAISGSYVNIVTVPANVYGEIFMWATTEGTASQARYRTASGFFRSNGTTCYSWAYAVSIEGTSQYSNGLKFGNGSDASGLNIRARTSDATDGLTWNYRITYRAI
jgi:hypothetical protein